MSTIKFATFRYLVNAGAVQEVRIVGLAGGWAIELHTPAQHSVLSTDRCETRRFGSFESALKLLRDLGLDLAAVAVSASEWQPQALIPTRRRPDRSEALKRQRDDAHYTTMLRHALKEAQADERPALSSADAQTHMDEFKRRMRVSMEGALAARRV